MDMWDCLPCLAIAADACGPVQEPNPQVCPGEVLQETISPLLLLHSGGETLRSFCLQLRGFSAEAESSGGRSRSTISRRHSLTRLPSRDSGASGPTEPLARRRRSVSEQDLRTCFLEKVQKEAELAALLKEADRTPREEKELEKLEVDLNVMKFELLFLKQRMESSFVVLEREKAWLEMLSSGGRKWKWKRKDKLFPLKMDLLQAKSCSGQRRNGLLSKDISQNEDMRKKDISQDTPALQENQVVQKDGIQALEEEQETMAQRLKSAHEEKDWSSAQVMGLEGKANEPLLKLKPALSEREGQMPGIKPGTPCVPSRGCSTEPQPSEMVHLEHAQKQQEGSDDQAMGLHTDLGGAKLQVSQEDPEKVLLKHQLESARQANRDLSLEVAESRQNLEASLDSLHLLETEKQHLETHIQALENEHAQLVGERDGRFPEGQLDGPNREEEFSALQVTCENLRESRSLLQREKDLLETRCLELKAALQGQREEMERHLAEQAQVSQCWQDRWEQVAAALKTKEEELEEAHLQSQASSAQHAECSLEKQRLDQLVASLEEQLAERERALRHLEEAGEEERAEKEMKISLLEQKLAEMEAVQDLPRRESNTTLETLEVQQNVAGEDGRSPGTCHHCSAALAQLNQAIQSAEKREKEDQTLACLYRLRDLLKGSLSDGAPVPKLVQSSNQDPAAKVIKSPQEEKEMLRRRHQLVTEQLKGLFRQRQQLEQSKKHLGGGKEERSQEPPKSQEGLAESPQAPEEQPATLDVPSNSAEVQRLQQLLKEKTETISSMASEIQTLQQKNESLMKAKLRFQQQIQQIRNLPKQQPERNSLELLVPRLSVTLGQDSHSAQGSDSSVPSPQSDELPFAGSREELSQTSHWSQLRTATEDQQRGSSPDEGTGQVPRAPPSPPIPVGSSSKPFSVELLSSLPADSEGALASPRGSVLLSPRPFGPPRPWSPFKFRGNLELPEGREKQ